MQVAPDALEKGLEPIAKAAGGKAAKSATPTGPVPMPPSSGDAPPFVDPANARLRTGASLRDGVAGTKDEVTGRFCIIAGKCRVDDIRRLDFVIVIESLPPDWRGGIIDVPGSIT
jgi:hypothetical protein